MKLKYHLIINLILIICSLPCYSNADQINKKFTYHQKTNDKVEILTHNFKTTKSGYLSRIETTGFWSETILDEGMNTLRYTFNPNFKTNVVIRSVRSGPGIKVDGPGINKTFSIKSGIWYQLNLVMSQLIHTDKKRVKFWILSSHLDEKEKRFKTVQFIMEKEMTENLTINGKKTDTIKATMTFDDMRSFFWKAFYWYRKEDGVLVKSEVKRGPPGTAVTTTTLIKEEDISFAVLTMEVQNESH